MIVKIPYVFVNFMSLGNNIRRTMCRSAEVFSKLNFSTFNAKNFP